jgi:hypothetical protein
MVQSCLKRDKVSDRCENLRVFIFYACCGSDKNIAA